MGHSWRIVDHPSMPSAGKREADGKPPLDNLTGISTGEQSIDSEETDECFMNQDHICF